MRSPCCWEAPHYEVSRTRTSILGLFPDWVCSVVEVQLEPGDVLAIYSDGITEATGLSDEEYGADRMRDHVLQPRASAETILADVRSFANGEGLHDDATVIFVSA